MYQHFIWNTVFVPLGLLMLICDIDIKNVMQERTLLLSLKSKTFSDWLFILFVYNKNQRRIQLNPLITNHAHSLYQWNIIQIFHPENVTHSLSFTLSWLVNLIFNNNIWIIFLSYLEISLLMLWIILFNAINASFECNTKINLRIRGWYCS